jgi:hypothetical protein
MKHINQSDSSLEAEITALKALGFLAADAERLRRFMDLSGLDVASIRRAAPEPGFLGGVLDHLLADQTLLLIFAEEHGMKPERVARLRRQLPGAALDL